MGEICGYCSRLIDQRLVMRWNAMLNGFHTGRWKGKFKYFGKSTIMRTVNILNPKDISVGDNTVFNKHCIIESWHFPYLKKNGEIVIGNNCAFGEYTHITTTNRIVIGDNLLTGRFVLITDNTHGFTDGSWLDVHPLQRKVVSKGELHIGNNVWIADKVVVMPGVTIGDGAIIAANAVVTHDIPAYSLAAGVPARVVKTMINSEYLPNM